MAAPTRVPAVEGWFTTGERRRGAGAARARAATACGTFAFPAEASYCRNPDCASTAFETVELSRRGRIWSYTDARYQPPPPYVAADPYVPFCLAAVELAAEKLVVHGPGRRRASRSTTCRWATRSSWWSTPSTPRTARDYLVWKWRPVAAAGGGED